MCSVWLDRTCVRVGWVERVFGVVVDGVVVGGEGDGVVVQGVTEWDGWGGG